MVKNVDRYGNLAWPQVTEVLASKWVLVPVGSVEQHGPHLPLDVDTVIPEALCKALSPRVSGLMAPTISYGARSIPASGGGPSYPGTIRIRGRVLIEFYEDIISGFISAGAHRILLLNGHYENEPLLVEAAERCREKGISADAIVVITSWWSMVSSDVIEEIFHNDFPGWHAEHAGQTETALMLYLAPERVGDERVDHPRPGPAGIYRHPVLPNQIGTKGVLSRTSGVTAEMGKTLFEHLVERLEQLLQEDVL